MNLNHHAPPCQGGVTTRLDHVPLWCFLQLLDLTIPTLIITINFRAELYNSFNHEPRHTKPFTAYYTASEWCRICTYVIPPQAE